MRSRLYWTAKYIDALLVPRHFGLSYPSGWDPESVHRVHTQSAQGYPQASTEKGGSRGEDGVKVRVETRGVM